jgi:hypothetical protein
LIGGVHREGKKGGGVDGKRQQKKPRGLWGRRGFWAKVGGGVFHGRYLLFVAEVTVNHMREGGKKDGDGKETERN